jgi:hypothetical protein
MGLFDALLGQEGVNLTGGGTVYDPTQNNWETRFDEQGNAYQAQVGTPLHPGHTSENSGPMFATPEFTSGLLDAPTETIDLGRQQVVQPSPQMMQPVPQSSFMPGSQESMAQNQQATIAPWLPEQTDYTDARNVMGAYQGGERIAQRDTGTFQDLTPNVDPSQAMEMMANFKAEGKALSETQFADAMNKIGMGDFMNQYRSQMDNVDESLADRDSFGNIIPDANAYEQDIDQALNKADRFQWDSSAKEANTRRLGYDPMTEMHKVNGTTPNVIPEPEAFKPDPTATDFWNEGAEMDFNIKQGIAKVMGVGEDIVDKVMPMLGDTTPAILMNENHPRNQEAKDLFLNLTRGAAQGLLHDLPQGTIDLGVDAINYGANKLGSDDVIDTEKSSKLWDMGYSEDQQKEFEDSTAYNLTKFGSQLVGGYGALAKVMGNANSASKFTRFLKEAVAVSVPGGTLDVTEGNISDLVNTTEYKNAVTEMMGSKVGDDASAEERFVARLKNMGEELTLGMSIPALYGLAKATKSALTDPQAMTKFMENMPGLTPPVEKNIIQDGGLLRQEPVDSQTRIVLNQQKADVKAQAQAQQQAQFDTKPKAEVDEAGFYSRAEQAALDLNQVINSPDDIKRYLSKQGVTNNEMNDMGLFKMLDEKASKGEKVTKDYLLDFIDDNKPRQSEVVLGGGGKDMWNDLQNDDGWEVADNYWKDDKIDKKTQDAYEAFSSDASGFDDYEELGVALSKHDPEKYPVGKEAEWQGRLFDTLDEFGYDGLDMNTSYDLDSALIDMYEGQYKQSPVVFKKVTVADGQDILVYKTDEGYVARPSDRFDNADNDIFDEPVDSIGEAIVKLQDKFGDTGVGKTKHFAHTQPGVDFNTYEETYITSDMIGNKGGYSYRPHLGDIEDVALHMRTSVRTDNSGRKVLFIEELQSDLHQSGRQKGVGYADKSSAAYQEEFEPIAKKGRELYFKEQNLIAKEQDEIKKVFDETGTLEFPTKIHPNRGEMVADFDDSQIKKAFDRNEKEIAELSEQISKYEGYIKDKDSKFDLNAVELHLNRDKDRMENLITNRSSYMSQVARKRVEIANPELSEQIRKASKETREFKESFARAEPDAPLKDDAWIQAGLEKAIMMAKKKGVDRVAWTDSSQQVNAWSDTYEDLYKELYDNKLPGAAKRIANVNNSSSGKVEMDFINTSSDEARIPDSTQSVNYIDINKKMLAGGVGIGVGGIALADEEIKPPLYTEPEKPMNSLLDGIKKPKVVRNVRNNNPGNIKDFGIKWDGMTGSESGGDVAEGSFVQFDTPENGVRALTKDLTNKRKRGLNTITKILNTYAPEGKENNTKAYIKDVANDVGVSPTAKLSDKDMFKMIKAITKHEGSKKSLKHFTDKVIIKGMKSAYKNRYQNVGNTPTKKQMKRWMKQDNWTGSEADYVQHIVKQQ